MKKPANAVCKVCGKPEKGRDWLWQVKGNTKDWFHIYCVKKGNV